MAQITVPRPQDGATGWAPVADVLLDQLKNESNSQDNRVGSLESTIAQLQTTVAILQSQNPNTGGGTPDGSFNVKDYGARGDGVTIDRASIQAAVNSANAAYVATGSTQIVYVPAGVYLLDAVNYTRANGTVFGAVGIMLLDGVTISGTYGAVLRMKASAYGSGAFFAVIRSTSTGVTKAGVRGITIDGNRANNIASTQCSNIVIEALTQVEVSGVKSINANGNGIMMRGSTATAATNLRIVNNFVSNVAFIGIQSSQFDGLEIDNNTIDGSTDNAIDVYGEDGDTTSHGRNFRVSNNRIRAGGVGIFLETVAVGVVTGNLVHDCTTVGLVVNRINGQPRETNIVGNTFANNPTGVRVTGDTGGVSIRNNTISGFTTAGVQLGGGGGNVSYVFVLDNTIDSATLNTGPLVLVTGNQVAFNRVRGTITRNTDRSLDDSSTATTLVGNSFAPANA